MIQHVPYGERRTRLARESVSSDVEVDVVVIGGGIAACWTTLTLRSEGYSVLMLTEAEIGGAQSSHSHVYVHGGHLYRREGTASVAGLGNSLISDLQWATRLWDNWLEASPERIARVTAAPRLGVFGFPSRPKARAARVVWEHYGLQYQTRTKEPPAPFVGGRQTRFFDVEAHCLSATAIFEEMRAAIESCLVAGNRTTFVTLPDGSVDSIRIETQEGFIDVRSRMVLLAAGAGNKGLLRWFPNRFGVKPVERNAFMFVMQGPRELLPDLSGIFSINDDDGLFIVSRKVDEDENCWLISDSCRHGKAQAWLAYLRTELDENVPALMADPAALRWGFYHAPKAEPEGAKAFASEVKSVTVVPVAPNVFVGWPIKLTLAPVLAQDFLSHVHRALRNPRETQPELTAHPHAVRLETWQTVITKPWDSLMDLTD